MSNKVTKELPEPDSQAGGWKPFREVAPSVVRADEPTVPRWFGTIGLALVLLGMFVRIFNAYGRSTWIGPDIGSLVLIIGIACLLYHAVRDTDIQVRRLYALLGFAGVAAGVITAVQAITTSSTPWFLTYGYPSLILGLLFLMPAARNETEEQWHQAIIRVIGAVGVICGLTGLIGGCININFLLDYGLLLSVLGLGYLWAFIALRGPTEDVGYKAGYWTGIAGALVFLWALGRSVIPPLFFSWGWISTKPTPHYLESAGVLLMAVGLLYVGLAAGLVSENRFAVLTRRELAAFFFSPLAYIVLFAFAAIAALQYLIFIRQVLVRGATDPMLEPIISEYIAFLLFVPIVVMILVVPLLTMRLLSEERRSGTLEVLLTSPVEETPIVLSKFVASLIVFVLAWLPFGLFLIALRVKGGVPFDYRPVISFTIALLCSGAGFVGMGLFFSALTRSAVAAGVLCAAGMLLFTLVIVIKGLARGTAWEPLLNHISYVDLWYTSLQGRLALTDVMFFVSSAVFWVFLTIKVLEARKWA